MPQESSRGDHPESDLTQHSADDCIDAIQEVAERISGPLRYVDYREHRDSDHPSGPTIVARIGWIRGCELADVDTTSFDRDDCVDAVAIAVVEHGSRISSREYSEWARGRRDVPSLTTIKKQEGGWMDVYEDAFQALDF
jgi:hypothetical protein